MADRMDFTVLIPSAAGPGCVNLTRGLKRISGNIRTIGADASPYFLFAAETDERVLVARREPEDAYLEALIGLCHEWNVDFIFPNNSLDGAILTRHQEKLPCPVFLPSPEAFDCGENKWESWKRFKEHNLPVPSTTLVHDVAEMEAAFGDLPGDRVWVRGAGIPGKGIGVASLPARSVKQAQAWIDYWDGWGQMTLSEYLPGANLTWLGVWNYGELVMSQCRQRDAYVIPHVSPSGITGAPAISHTVHREDINRLGPAACLAIDPNFHGPAFVDFKENDDGVACITEINVGRFGTTHNFYSQAGASFPEVVLRLAMGLSLPEWVKSYDVLPADLYWVRTLDVGPVLVTRQDIERLGLTKRIER